MRRRAEPLLIVAIALLPALAALHSRPLFSPDETSYAEVAREMAERGDFVVPCIDGHPWLEKPPLVYWLLAASFALFGWGLPAATIANAALTAVTALVIWAHLRREGLRVAPLVGALAYLTMFLPMAAARTALTDPALTLATTVAIVTFARRGLPGSTAAGAALGLGILAKGPAALLVVLPAWATLAVRRRPRDTQGLSVALAVAVAVAAPWHLLLAHRGLLGEFAATFLGQQVISRAVDTWRVKQPFWFYLPALWLAAFPWGTHLVLAVREASARIRRRLPDANTRLAEAAAVLAPLVVFSAAKNKLPHYVLPVLPWLAAWLGIAVERRRERGKAQTGRFLGFASAGLNTAFLAGLAVLAVRSDLGRALPPLTPWLLVAAAVACASLGFIEGGRRPELAWIGVIGVALLLRLGLDLMWLPALGSQMVEPPLAHAVARALPEAGLPIAHRWWRSSFVAYGVRGWARTGNADELDSALAGAARDGRPALLLARADAEGEARTVPWRRGGEAREVARISGLGEVNGETIEGVVFQIVTKRDGRSFFYDADHALPGEAGLADVEGNRWTPSYRFTTATVALVPVAAEPQSDSTVRLRVWGLPDRNGHPQVVSVRLNGVLLGSTTLGRFPRVVAFAAPVSAMRPTTQQLAIEAGHLTVPQQIDPASHDGRGLGVALDWIAMESAPAPQRLYPPAAAAASRPSR